MVSGELRRHVGGVAEVACGGDGFDQEEIAAAENAGPRDSVRASQILKDWQAHQCAEREPLAGCSIGGDGADADRPEGGVAETGERLDGADGRSRSTWTLASDDSVRT